jgi:hypothetical protein
MTVSMSDKEILTGRVMTVRGTQRPLDDAKEAGVGFSSVNSVPGVYVIVRPTAAFEKGAIVNLTLDEAEEFFAKLSRVMFVAREEGVRREKARQTNKLKEVIESLTYVANDDDPDWSVLLDAAKQLTEIRDEAVRRR